MYKIFIFNKKRDGVKTCQVLPVLELQRRDEARVEVLQAIKCKEPFGHVTQSWTTWAVLSEIEMAEGYTIAAIAARRKAIDSYLAYRRDGGEDFFGLDRLMHTITPLVIDGNSDQAATILKAESENPRAQYFMPFLNALLAIATGNRDRKLADDQGLHYAMAAEVLLLLEEL